MSPFGEGHSLSKRNLETAINQRRKPPRSGGGRVGEWMMKGLEKSLPLLAANSSRMAKMRPAMARAVWNGDWPPGCATLPPAANASALVGRLG